MSRTRYTRYERAWHWLQALVILGLLGTGLELHAPERVGLLGFRRALDVHLVLGAVLLLNAALALFQFLVSGAIERYLPRPREVFTLSWLQARYYLRGIFAGEPHPIARGPLNPLQQVTYLAILNLLLPAQVLTGVAMWGLDRWPALIERLGGLGVLLPLHTLLAWFFAAFLVAHVYLTTTGETPLANLRSMLGGDEGGVAP